MPIPFRSLIIKHSFLYYSTILIYNHFKNAATQIITKEQFLPISDENDENGENDDNMFDSKKKPQDKTTKHTL